MEVIQWAGNSDSKLADALSRPGMWIQGLTTKEPTADMVEVAIKSVEAVFDWRAYLAKQRGENANSAEKADAFEDSKASEADEPEQKKENEQTAETE